MRSVFFILAAALCVGVGGCRENSPVTDNAVSGQYFVSSHTNRLRAGDSTQLAIDFDTTLTTEVRYQWQTDAGKIAGQGRRVTFIAPGTRCTVNVHLTVFSDSSVVYQELFPIFVYKQLVILKADDMEFAGSNIIHMQWRRYLQYISALNLKSGVGVIGYSLLVGNADYFALLDSLQNTGSFELFNHGYTHNGGVYDTGGTYYEFFNTPYDYQREHLMSTQDLAKTRLGVTLHAFGAPADSTDANTLRVIDECDDITVWFNGNPRSKKAVIKEYGCHIETPAFYPNYQKFMTGYDPKRMLYMFEIHPANWDEQRFNEFRNIITYLMTTEATFILPSEYYSSYYRHP